jgi:16S rRNA (uracil1498-N3)-methyltransferase
MTLALFLLPELQSGLSVGSSVSLSGAEAHHAAAVKRVAVGEEVLLSDGRGIIARAMVLDVFRDEVRLQILQRTELAEPSLRFTVVQALPKRERGELAVAMLTELGVDEIVPWSASRSVSLWRGGADGTKAVRGAEKWRRTAAEAAKQSRRARIPVVGELADTHEVARRVAAARLALVLHEEAESDLGTLALQSMALPDEGEILLVVGPEGGLDAAELSRFYAAGARAVRLGPWVLRTSTAGPAALAALSLLVGRWSGQPD